VTRWDKKNKRGGRKNKKETVTRYKRNRRKKIAEGRENKGEDTHSRGGDLFGGMIWRRNLSKGGPATGLGEGKRGKSKKDIVAKKK